MSTIKKGVLRGWNIAIAWFLSMFGIACNPFTAEYGTPQGQFIVDGTVRSEETNSPVEQIRVIMGRDTAYSDVSGKYKVSTMEFPTDQTFNLNFTDTDGPDHGSFEVTDTLIQFTDPEFHKGDGHWYSGETKKEVNVRLKAKK